MNRAVAGGMILVFGAIDLYLALHFGSTIIFCGIAASIITAFLVFKDYPFHLSLVKSLVASVSVGVGSLVLAWLMGFIVAAAV